MQMLIHPPTLRICLRAYRIRCIASVASGSLDPGHSEHGVDQDDGMSAEPEVKATTEYGEWLSKHGIKWKAANKPQNWLTHEEDGRRAYRPFPLNMSFNPPPPLSDALRTQLYTEFMVDPEENSIRRLAERYHLSLKRVDAVLRLKGLEAHFIKKKVLQTGFQAGMEILLGVPQEATDSDDIESSAWPGSYDTVQADVLDQEEGRDIARQKYQRMFWEAVPDHKEPIMPLVLENYQKALDARHKEYRDAKSDPLFMPPYENNPPKVNLVQREGRPSVKFIDVGGKFVVVKDRLNRIKQAERRRKKKDEKQAAGGLGRGHLEERSKLRHLQ